MLPKVLWYPSTRFRMVMVGLCVAFSAMPINGSSIAKHCNVSNTTPNTEIAGEIIRRERGVNFVVGRSFFRDESRVGRDPGVLAAALHRKRTGKLHVLDAMCGCGVRALRYLLQANADFVWANDANEEARPTILANLSQLEGKRKWVISHGDASRVLSERYLMEDYYDLIDVDSFGSDTSFFGAALSAIRHGGLLYLTSTDGFSSAGHHPHNALTSYGAYIKPMPYANEIGLRMLIGGAVREASTRNMEVRPLFSLYSYHGPVFRVMLQVTKGKPETNRHYGFISYCRLCGDSQAFPWDRMGQMVCPCTERKVSRSLVISGPLWTGPLHSSIEIEKMTRLAEEWGWAIKEECCSSDKLVNLNKLLHIMLEESAPELPFGYIKLDEIARRGKINAPRRDDMIKFLTKEGYAASRSHIAANAIKTNCPVGICIKVASMYTNSPKQDNGVVINEM